MPILNHKVGSMPKEMLIVTIRSFAFSLRAPSPTQGSASCHFGCGVRCVSTAGWFASVRGRNKFLAEHDKEEQNRPEEQIHLPKLHQQQVTRAEEEQQNDSKHRKPSASDVHLAFRYAIQHKNDWQQEQRQIV